MSENRCCCEKKVIDEEKEKIEKIKQIIEKHKGKNGALIPVLHETQDFYGYLPLKVQRVISEELNIPLAEIYGVVTLYEHFTTQPIGKYKIQVCMGTACYVKGAAEIRDKLIEKLGIEIGKSTDDGKFSLEATRCIGSCGLAPVIMINDVVYGRLTPDRIEEILDKYNESTT